MKLRLILALASVPLMAFNCAPSPNLNVTVRSETASTHAGAVYVRVDKSQFQKITTIVQEFASRFSATRSSECSPDWWWNRPPDGPCAFFSNGQHEGIMIEVFYDPSPERFRIVLIKDARPFGRYSISQVEDAFNQLVVERLRRQYGDKSVRLDH